MLETIKQYWRRYIRWREQILKEAYNIDDDTNESTEDRDWLDGRYQRYGFNETHLQTRLSKLRQWSRIGIESNVGSWLSELWISVESATRPRIVKLK